MNPRFLAVGLPILVGIVTVFLLAGLLAAVPDLWGISPDRAILHLAELCLLVTLITFLGALVSHRLFRDMDRQVVMLRRRLESAEQRRRFDESQALVMNRVNDLHETFSVSRDMNVVLNQAVSALRDVLQVKTLVLQLYSDEESRFFLRIEEGGEDIDLGDELRMEVIEDGKSRLINNLAFFAKYSELTSAGYSSLIVAPLNRIETGGRRKSVGLIAALSKERRDFTSYDLDLLTLFSKQAALLIENARLYKRVEQLAIRDGLTNLFNHRHFQEVLSRELKTAQDSGLPLSLIILDIDDFKGFNDTYGHPKGDEALRAVADILLENTKGRDLVARYGGEEFVVILPETSRPGATRVAENIREEVESFPLPADDPAKEPHHITITAGLAAFPHDASTAKDLISAADQAMYLGKRSGKNRVSSAS